MTAAPSIPFVKQSTTPGPRDCGAACLSMAYRSFGHDVSPDEIWPSISKQNALGSLASTTHLMAKDAIDRGFDAIVFQANQPLHAVQACLNAGLRVIANHRLDPDSPSGHYSVITSIDRSRVTLHDPMVGPSRVLSLKELLDLWRRALPVSETIGYVLIAIGPKTAADVPACQACKLPFPAEVACPRCKTLVNIRPAAALGCTSERCSNRYWSFLCCPVCDCMWSFKRQYDPKPAAAPPPAAAAKPADPLDVDQIYSAIDKFVNRVLEIPGASDNPDLRPQLEQLYAQKEPLRMSIAEAAAERAQRLRHLDALKQMANSNSESLQKRQEAANRQSPPLDGDALGMALLRNLGFVR